MSKPGIFNKDYAYITLRMRKAVGLFLKENGLTQRDLSEMIGAKKTYIGDFLRRGDKTNIKYLNELAKLIPNFPWEDTPAPPAVPAVQAVPAVPAAQKGLLARFRGWLQRWLNVYCYEEGVR